MGHPMKHELTKQHERVRVSFIWPCATYVLYKNKIKFGGACGVMVIVVGNGHGNKSSNPGRD